MKHEIIPLSKRENEILSLIAGDCLNPKQIATRLCRSVKTIETHRQNILRKLCLHSTQELCRFYWTEGEGMYGKYGTYKSYKERQQWQRP